LAGRAHSNEFPARLSLFKYKSGTPGIDFAQHLSSSQRMGSCAGRTKNTCGESSMWGDYHAREAALYLHKLLSEEKYYTFFDSVNGNSNN
jgi:hypothetical protein